MFFAEGPLRFRQQAFEPRAFFLDGIVHPGKVRSPASPRGKTGKRKLFLRQLVRPTAAGLQRKCLQVRLEVGVIANLLVNLQPVPLAVGDDDRLGVRIKVDRGREAEAPLRLPAFFSRTWV